MALLDKHLGKCETNKDSDLILRPYAKAFERFFVVVLANDTDDMQVLVNHDLSGGEQKLQVGINPFQYRRKIELSRFGLCGTYCR